MFQLLTNIDVLVTYSGSDHASPGQAQPLALPLYETKKIPNEDNLSNR